MSARTTLVLITKSYPYNPAAETFLENEIEYLKVGFERVIILPDALHPVQRSVPAGVEVDTTCARPQPAGYPRREMLQLGLTSPLLWSGLREIGKYAASKRAVGRLLRHAWDAEQVRQQVGDFIRKRGIDPATALFYTYWFDFATLGIGQLKEQYPGLKLVSRAHGYDVYETRHRPPFIAFRSETLRRLDRLFTISDHGRKHLTARYPWFAPACETARLGVKPAGTRTPASSDGVLRVVSCSAMVAVKRLNLMAQGLGRLASEYPDLPIEWTHLGDGEERDRLEAAARGLPPNLRAIFPGSLANAQVLDFYRTHPVDVFLNTSQSEGIPVAMMEAQSFGIPIAAPDVGAVSEIVTGENGVLMSADPSPEEIARAVANLADCTHNTAKRAESLRTWLERYNAGTNYPRFVERLKVERLKVERLKVERLKAVDG